jgi:hypothetical protein
MDPDFRRGARLQKDAEEGIDAFVAKRKPVWRDA